MTDVAAILGVVAVIALAAALLRAREGAVRPIAGAAIDLAAFDVPPGASAFVEFTAPGCVPCARTAQVLRGVTAERPDVAVVTVDVGEHLPLAREHRVMRTPTTLLVDPTGAVRHRIAGVPDPDAVAALLDRHHEAAA